MRHLSLTSLLLTSTLLTAAPLTQEDMIQQGSAVSTLLVQKLGGELKTQMQTSGALGALHFCSQNAQILTEQVGKESNTSIKRVSINNRNPINKANKQETALLNEWSNLVKSGKPLPSHILVKTSDTSTSYYKPIVINNEACLKCHGNIEGDLAKAIAIAYPEDKATGYKMGDLRGMIVISY
jgi:hypothetical protein